MKIFFNNELLEQSDMTVEAFSRGICYGDAVFETLRVVNKRTLIGGKHLERLRKAASFFGMDYNGPQDAATLNEMTKHLLSANGMEHARLRITVCRSGDGNWIPLGSSSNLLMEVSPMQDEKYILSPIHSIEVYRGMHKTYSPLSEIKTAQNAVHLLAGIYAYENKLDDCFILNETGNVAECISSNVFAVFGDKILTPFISEACLPGIMRGLLLDRSAHVQLKAGEGVLCLRDIEEADEVFLTSMEQGIVPISSFHGKSYTTKTAERLIQVVNDKLIRTF